jgi:hypothetical protein
MDLEHIPRKTDKGYAEVRTRAFHVGARERSILIMVDGKTPARLLLARLAFMNKANDILDELRVGGFIDVEVPAEQTLLAVPVTPLTDALRTRQFARDFVLETLGAAGDDLVNKLEACLSRERLTLLLVECRDGIEAGAGRHKTQEFWDGLGRVTAAMTAPHRMAA